MDLIVRAKSQVNHVTSTGEKVPEGARCVSLIPEYIEDPQRPGQRWNEAVVVKTTPSGFELTSEREQLLRDFGPGDKFKITISRDTDQ
jgi:hypothetical protein